MSHSHPSGLLAAYNSLTDKHLAGYFNNTRIRRHLLRSGLITRSGRILSEKEYKLNIMKRDHQRYIRECLAQAIFHKVLDMERYHQLEIKKKLETLARKERIQRFKGEPMRWSIEKSMPVLSPHPPGGPKASRGHSGLVEDRSSSPVTLTAPRPYTAPGITQPPIRLQPLPSNPAVGTIPKVPSGSRSKTSPLENDAPFPIVGKKAVMKFRNSMDNSQGMNRYQLLNINSYMMPIPPPSPPPDGKITRENRSETWRRRRFHPTTAPNSLEPIFTRDSRRINKTPLHSNAVITMVYLGKNVHLSYDHPDFRDEIKVYQQHCGGENLCVYKGKLLEKETFQFISKRHHGFPFSLTFFLNGMQVNRLSSCCKYKHRKGSRLGGKRGYFGFVCVERSSPCYKCIIAMGLDKKLTSPKLKKQISVEKGEELKKGEGKLRRDRAYVKTRRNEMEGSKSSASGFFSAEEEKTGVEEVRTAVEEMEHKRKQHVWEDDQENIYKYEYEEDFEVEEEKQDEKANEEGRDDDQMDGMSKSPSDDEKDHLDPEKESETSSQKAPDADGSVKDEGDGCSESELEEDKQDIKTASSSSSRSHPYSSCSEDESALGDREAHAAGSPNLSVRSSSSQDFSETDQPGKPPLPTEESLQIEDQKIIKANVETKPLVTEGSWEDVLEEQTKKGTQVIAEGLSEKFREHVSKEEKENYARKLWKGSTAKVKDKMAGPCRVEKGVGQILAEAAEPGCHSPYDAESGVSSTDEGEKPSTELETDTGAAPNTNSVVEESTVLNSNKESKPKKEETVEEDEVPQHRDADTVEEKGGPTLCGKAGVDEVPLGEWKPTAEQPALAELFIEEREIPQGTAGRAEVEGNKKLSTEELHPTGKKAARASEGLNGEEAPKKQALMQTVLETEKAASKEEQGSEKAVFASQAAAPKSECIPEVAALGEAAMQEKKEAERGVAASEAGSEKPNVEDGEEEASIDQGDLGPEQDTVSEREDGLEEAILGGEEPAKMREAVVRTETPLSSPTSDKPETTRMKVLEESLEELCKKDEKRKEVETEVESNEEDDRKETLPEESDAERKRMKAERPKAPLGETESEREEVTRANALQDEDILEEERKFKGQEVEIVKELRTEKETQGPQNEMECDVENETPVEASELIEDTMWQEDSLREREVTMSEIAPGCEKSLENIIAVRKERGGERLRESGDTEYKGKAEPLCGENVALPEQEEGPSPEGEGVLGAPEIDSKGQVQAAEVRITAAGEAQECAAKDQDDLVALERRVKEGSLQERQEVGATAMTQEYISEGDPKMAEKLCEEVVDEDLEEEVDKECTLWTAVMKAGHTEAGGSLQGGMVVADKDLQEGGAAETAKEKTEMLAHFNMAKGKTEANTASSFSDVTGEEAWHKVDELLGKTAAAEKVVAEEIALSREGVPAVGEVTVTEASEAEVEALGEASVLEGKAPQLGRDRKEGEVGAEARMGSPGGAQESGEAEDFRLGLSQERESEQSRESLQDVEILPVKADCPGTQEKQEEHRVQRESENIDVSLNKNKA